MCVSCMRQLKGVLIVILGDCQGGKWSLVRWGKWDIDVLLWSEGFVWLCKERTHDLCSLFPSQLALEVGKCLHRPNVNALRKCILEGPYTPSTVIIPVVLATDNSLAIPERTTVETVLNMSPENKAHFESEKEAIHLILIGIGDEIYSTVDACKTTHEMWEAIERLQQVATMQVNVKFLQQLQQEWSRFVTIFKQQHKLDEVSYHKLFDILKQYQKEVNELHVEKIAKNANPLALVATAQPYQDPYYQALKSYKSYAPTSKASLTTRSHAATRHKGKEIAKQITPLSQSASKEDSDPEQAQKDKEMQKNLALIAKNQRTMTVAGARETVGGQVVQQSGIQCFNCKEFEKGVPLQAEQSDWLVDTDEGIDEQELEAHYSYMAKIQEVSTVDSGTDSEPLEQVQYDTRYNMFVNEIQHSEQFKSISNTCVVETGDSNVIPDSSDMCDNDIQNDQNAVECDDERVALANLIANLKLDVDENKKIQKQLKKANASLTQELTGCKSILAKTSRTLGESNSIRDSCLVALQNKQTEFERYKNLNDRTVDYEKLESKLNETLRLLAQKYIDIKKGLKLKAYEISVVKEKHDELVKQSLLTKSHYEGLVKEKTKLITDLKLKEEKDSDKMISMEKQLKFLNEIVYKRSQSIQTVHMLAPKCPTFNGRPTFANLMYLKKAQYKKPCLYEIPHDQSDPINRLVPDREEILTLKEESRSKLNKDLDHFRAPIAHDMEILIKTCLMPLALKTLNDSFVFIHELKQEMLADLKYVESLEKEIDKLESDKAEFSNMYDMLYKEVYNELLQSFAKLEKHSISLELALQQCQEQLKNDTVCKEKASNKLIEKCKGKSVETKFDKPSVVRQPNAQRNPKPSVLGKPAPFSDSFEKKHFSKTKSVPKTNASKGLSKPVTTQNLPQTTTQAVSNTNVIKPGMYRINTRTTQTRAPQLPQTSRNTNPRVSTSTGVNHRTIVSRPQLKSNKMNEKVVPNTSQVKFKKTEVEDHHRISSISNQSKFIIACNDNLKSRTSNVNAVCATCGKLSKAKRSLFKTKAVPNSKGRLNLLHRDLCGLMWVASINGKKYILKSSSPVISVRTDRGTMFLNTTLNAFFKKEGTEHQNSTPRTPEQNGVVERRNRTLVEAARTMLSASKLPLFFWSEAIATACYIQNRSIIILAHEKTAYHIINDMKPLIKHLYIFGCTCYLTKDGENLDRMKEKGDPCILVGYSTQSKGYRVYNKRTHLIVESIHLRFDEIKEMSDTSIANDTSGLIPQRQKASDYDNSDPVLQLQNVSPSADTTTPSQQELELLFGPLYDEFFSTGTSCVNKSSFPTDNFAKQDKQPTMNIHPTTKPSTPTNIHAEENKDDQAEDSQI
ncbi:retrovirus-related pol polyprotein from transposon TNT 1-94 [Tanacetum coccineum]